jgi:hypothetical protein
MAPHDDYLGQTVVNITHMRPNIPTWLPIMYSPVEKGTLHFVSSEGWLLVEVVSGITDVRKLQILA